MAYESVEEQSDEDEADGREDEALTGGEDESVLQFAQGDAGEEEEHGGEAPFQRLHGEPVHNSPFLGIKLVRVKVR